MLRLVLIALAAVGCLGQGPTKPPQYQLELEVFNSNDNKYHHHCDAAVVSDRYGLTSACCVEGVTPYVGRFRHGNEYHGIGGNVHNLEKITVHENHISQSVDYDVAVVRVKEPFLWSCAIPMVQVSPSANTLATSTGWGVLPSGTHPHHIQEAKYPVFDHKGCQKIVGSKITKRVLCAGHFNGNNDACGGDLGAPLVVNQLLVGVGASSKCGSERHNMGLFADVADLYPWIKEKILK